MLQIDSFESFGLVESSRVLSMLIGYICFLKERDLTEVMKLQVASFLAVMPEYQAIYTWDGKDITIKWTRETLELGPYLEKLTR
jgi:hypothetical protein